MAENKRTPAIRFREFSGAWEEQKLGEIIDQLTGGCSIAPDDYIKNGCKTIPKGAVNTSGIADLSGCKFVSKNFFEKNKNSTVKN